MFDDKSKLKKYINQLSPVLIVFLWIIPVLWMFITAIKSVEDTFTLPPKWIGDFTIRHFVNVIARWPFMRWMLNSLLIATITTLVSVIIAIFAAYSLARLDWKGKNTIFLIFIASMLIPWQVNAVPLYFIMDKIGLLNSYFAVSLPIIAMPISIFLLRQFFINIPQELEDAAKIDGCGTMGIIWKIIVPISLPALSALVIYMFIFTWNEFFWSMIALQDTEMFTLPIGLKALQGAHDIKYNILMAGASLATLPILGVYLILQRKIINGITMSSASLK